MGVSEEEIQRLGLLENPEDQIETVEVLRCNRWAVRCFRCCEFELLPIFTGTAIRWVYRGIPAAEIDAAMRSLRVPEKSRPRAFRGVRTMVQTALELLNKDD